jgi:hypothetical protein
MATYATWQDVVDTYELPIPAEHQPRIEKLLAQASARLTALVPSLPTRVNAGTVDPELPSSLVVDAVLRVYRNPAGVTQQTVGPFNRSFSKDAQHNDLYFDPAQVQALLASISDHGVGVGTFRVGIPAPQMPVSGLDADGRYQYTPEAFRGVL